jgi:hypothetical protein
MTFTLRRTAASAGSNDLPIRKQKGFFVTTYAPSSEPSPLVAELTRFNRKEGFCLLRHAIGLPFNQLAPNFLKELGDLLKITIPPDAWWALDYHIDWLFGALLTLTHKGKLIDQIEPQPNPHPGYEMGTQEDCDLIIAFETTLILIEAKTGAWKNKQMNSKIARLAALPAPQITRYLVLVSPRKPTKLQFANWPGWALNNMDPREPFWLELPFMDGIEEPLMVSRCDSGGTPSRSGDHWGVYPP